MAPLERGRERVLPRGRRPASGAEHAETVVEPLRDCRRSQRSQATGGELERERQAVEAKADARNVKSVVVANRKPGHRGIRPFDEEPHGLVAEHIAGLECVLGIRDVQGRNPKHDLSANMQRFAACGKDRQLRGAAQQGVGELRRRCEQMLAVVENKQKRTRPDKLDDRIDEAVAGQRAHVEGRRNGIRHEPAIG